MSSGQRSFNAGQAHGQAQAKTEELIQSAKNAAGGGGQSQLMRDSAQEGRDQNPGFLQQTGEQMMSMAQGAIDGVKNTLGVGERK